MSRFRLNFFLKVIIPSLLITATAVGLRQLGLLQFPELKILDQFTRMAVAAEEEEPILIVGINEEDLELLGTDTVTDQTLAEAIAKLQEKEPRVIGLDIFRDIPVGDSRGELVATFEEDNLIAVCYMNYADDPGVAPPPELPEAQVGFADLPQDLDEVQRRSLLLSLPPLPLEPFSPTERHFCNQAETPLPSFALQVAKEYLEEEDVEVELTQQDTLRLGEEEIEPLLPGAGGYSSEELGGFQILINYVPADKLVEEVSLQEVLAEEVPAELISDRIVLIGYTAPSKGDIFLTPYGEMAGVIVHAQIVNQLIDLALEEESLAWYPPLPGEIAWIFLWSLLGGLVGAKGPLPLPKLKIWQVAAADVAGIIILGGICYVTFISAGRLPVVTPALALVTTSIIVYILPSPSTSEQKSEARVSVES